MMETVGLIVVHSSLLVSILLTCGRTKNEKAAATPGVLGSPTKVASVQDEAPAASPRVTPAPTSEASPAVAPAAPSVDRADVPSDVSTASSAVSTASPPTVATAASPTLATAALPSLLTARSPKPYSESFTESIKEEHTRNYIKCVGLEMDLPGEFCGVFYGPSERYAIIKHSSKDKPMLFPMFVIDVCRSTYTMYTTEESDKRIEQIRNGEFYWLADDLIVIVLYKNDQLIRYIYELDHKKKTVSYVYTGQDTCKFLVQSTDDHIETTLQEANIRNRKYVVIVGRDSSRFQLFNKDPRVEPRYPHSFRLDVDPGITRRLSLIEDRDCWSVTTLGLAAPDIILQKNPFVYLVKPSHFINIFRKEHSDSARRNVRFHLTIIDFDTNKCYTRTLTTQRDTMLNAEMFPFVKIEEWTWDKASGGLSWTTLKSFPPTKVATLRDIAREAVMRNRQKYSQDLPDLAWIVFPQ